MELGLWYVENIERNGEVNDFNERNSVIRGSHSRDNLMQEPRSLGS